MTHELKILPENYEAVMYGIQTFDGRKNDRGFQLGDYIKYKECTRKNFTGRELMVEITFIAMDAPTFGLKMGYCAIGFKLC